MEVTPGYRQTDVGIVPENWEVHSVASMGEVRAGKALAAKGPGKLRPYLRTKNVFDGRIDIEDVLRMPMTDSEFSQYQLRYGDVLLNEGQSIELVGRCAMYKGEFSRPCAIQNQLVRFRAYEGTSASFATHLFRRCQQVGTFSKIAMQTTSVAHLGVSRFANLRLAWPPTRAEQEAIAEALSDADALIESLEQLVDKKRQIKHGAMQELLTGKKRLPGFTETWEIKRLGDVVDTDVESLGAETRPEYAFNYISLEAVDCGTLLSFTEQVFRSAPSRARRKLRKNDVLVSTVRPNLLSHLLFAEDGEHWVCSTGFCVVRCRLEVSHPCFVYSLLFADGVKKQIEALLTGSNYPAINSSDVRALQIPFPGYAEQSAISDVLSDMSAEITAQEVKLAKIRQVKQGMMQDLLTGRIRLK